MLFKQLMQRMMALQLQALCTICMRVDLACVSYSMMMYEQRRKDEHVLLRPQSHAVNPDPSLCKTWNI